MLTLCLKRISPTHHTFAYKRADGTGEAIDVETKSFLKHDLIHYALESEAHIKNGFYGLIEQGHAYAELSGKTEEDYGTAEAMQVERVVGPLSSEIEGEMALDEFIRMLENLFASHKESLPSWVTQEVLERARKRYREINGHWNALAFGETLEFTFEGG